MARGDRPRAPADRLSGRALHAQPDPLCTLIAPVAVYLHSPDTVTTRLQAWKRWLATNSGTILTVLLVFYGALLIAEGANGLL